MALRGILKGRALKRDSQGQRPWAGEAREDSVPSGYRAKIWVR